MLTFEIDRNSALPLKVQIAEAIRERILSGALGPGERLPSSRDLADQLAVNRATVVHSFRELKADGWIDSGVGRGTFVCERPGARRAPAGHPPRLDWTAVVGRRQPARFSAPSPTGAEPVTPLGHAVPGPGLFPVDLVREALDRAFTTHGAALLDYPGPSGYPPLREALADRFAARGIDMSRNEVLITSGSQQGLKLVADLLLGERAHVLTSRPTYAGALSVFRWLRCRCTGVPMDANGMQVGRIDLGRRRPKLIYEIPYCHNPTGLTLAPDRCEALVEMSARHGVPVLEDDWLGELRPPGEPIPLKSRDRAGSVLYLGTMSKVLVPGLRVGWLVVPRELFTAMVDLRSASDLCAGMPGQVVLHDLLERGQLDTHTARVRETLECRQRIALDAIDRCFPEPARTIRPADPGMVIWVELPPDVDTAWLVAAARQAGVGITDGAAFDPDGAGISGFRICLATAEEADLVPALERLGTVLEQALVAAPAGVGRALI